MDSPVKKLDFSESNKENIIAEETKPLEQAKLELKKNVVEEVKLAVAPTIKASEADEPLLQENPQRFVLFPIKYHEVSHRVARERRRVRTRPRASHPPPTRKVPRASRPSAPASSYLC